MNDEHDDDTQTIADARQTRQLVLASVLRLAGKVLDKVEADEDLAFATVHDELPAGGFAWKLTASGGPEYDFVRVTGVPDASEQGPMVPVHVMAQIMGNQAAQFDTQIPREWVRLALKGAADGIEESLHRR